MANLIGANEGVFLKNIKNPIKSIITANFDFVEMHDILLYGNQKFKVYALKPLKGLWTKSLYLLMGANNTKLLDMDNGNMITSYSTSVDSTPTKNSVNDLHIDHICEIIHKIFTVNASVDQISTLCETKKIGNNKEQHKLGLNILEENVIRENDVRIDLACSLSIYKAFGPTYSCWSLN